MMMLLSIKENNRLEQEYIDSLSQYMQHCSKC